MYFRVGVISGLDLTQQREHSSSEEALFVTVILTSTNGFSPPGNYDDSITSGRTTQVACAISTLSVANGATATAAQLASRNSVSYEESVIVSSFIQRLWRSEANRNDVCNVSTLGGLSLYLYLSYATAVAVCIDQERGIHVQLQWCRSFRYL
jgi:hypothetical protein